MKNLLMVRKVSETCQALPPFQGGPVVNDPHHHPHTFSINPGDIIHVPPEAVQFFHRPMPRFNPPKDIHSACVQPMMVRLHQTSSGKWRFPKNSAEKGKGLVMFSPAIASVGGHIQVLLRDPQSVCSVHLDVYELYKVQRA